MIEEVFNQIVRKFNEKAEKDQNMRAELEGIERKLQIDLEDGRSYICTLKDCKLTPLSEGKF
ncbi:MAG: hypothetical protein ACPL1Y_03585, partial [Thermoplasmata archaeon]